MNKKIEIDFDIEEFKVGHRVVPKLGCNYLRAGVTAYGEAVIMQAAPLVIITLDGLFYWSGFGHNLFDVKEKVADPTRMLLMDRYNQILNEEQQKGISHAN